MVFLGAPLDYKTPRYGVTLSYVEPMLFITWIQRNPQKSTEISPEHGGHTPTPLLNHGLIIPNFMELGPRPGGFLLGARFQGLLGRGCGGLEGLELRL